MAIKNKSISFGHGAFWRSIPVLALAAALVYGAGDLVEKGQALNALTPQVPVLGWCLWILVAVVVWLVFLQPVVQFLRLRTLQDAHPRQLLKDARRRMLRLQRIDPTSGAVSQCLSLINAALQCDEEDAVLKSAESTPAQKLACLRRCVRRMQQTGGDEDAWRSLAEKLRNANDAEALVAEYERLRLRSFPQLAAVRTQLENDYAKQRPLLEARWEKLRNEVSKCLNTTPAADLTEFTKLTKSYLAEMNALSEGLESGDMKRFSAAYGKARNEMNRLAAEMEQLLAEGLRKMEVEVYALQIKLEQERLISTTGGDTEERLKEAKRIYSLYEPDPKLRSAFRGVETVLQQMEAYAEEGVTLRRVFCEYRRMSGLEEESRRIVLDYSKIAAIAAVFRRGRLLQGVMILLVQVRMVVALAKMHGYRPSAVFNMVCLVWVLAHSMITTVFLNDVADAAGEKAADALSGVAEDMLADSDEAVQAGMEGGMDAGGTLATLAAGAFSWLDGGVTSMIVGTLGGGVAKTLVKGGVSLLVEAALAGAGVYVTGRVFLRQLTGEAGKLGFRNLLELRREGIREMLSYNSTGIASAVKGVFTSTAQKAVNTMVEGTKKTVETVVEGTKKTVDAVFTNPFKKMWGSFTRH